MKTDDAEGAFFTLLTLAYTGINTRKVDHLLEQVRQEVDGIIESKNEAN
ncbi:MAG: hypothetical protein V4457_11210 [Pseudomonadota bacterium]